MSMQGDRAGFEYLLGDGDEKPGVSETIIVVTQCFVVL